MKTNETKQIYVCRRLKLLNFLMSKGFKPLYTMPDAYNPKFNCWTFTNTPELVAAVTEYYAMPH